MSKLIESLAGVSVADGAGDVIDEGEAVTGEEEGAVELGVAALFRAGDGAGVFSMGEAGDGFSLCSREGGPAAEFFAFVDGTSFPRSIVPVELPVTTIRLREGRYDPVVGAFSGAYQVTVP